MTSPAHHRPDGRFRSPWPMAAGDDALRCTFGRVAREWLFGKRPPDPAPGAFPVGVPALAGLNGVPKVGPGEVRITWIGHASTVIQFQGLNVLTDPVWSDRCSPVGFTGPRRFVPPPVKLEDLPAIHAVLLSHDHYDHLDRPTVRAIHARWGDGVTWYTPLGYRSWFAAQGITRVVERDWWESATLPGGSFDAVAVPARHWTRRRPGDTNRRLWCGWVIRPPGSHAAADSLAGPRAGPRVYFAGDSGYCPAFKEVGDRFGPFDASLIPIGAYEPNWFMGPAHMNPEEAVQAYLDAGGKGAFVGIHWGTWRLTFEDPREPPVRARAAWAAARLAEADLHLLRHGQTLALP